MLKRNNRKQKSSNKKQIVIATLFGALVGAILGFVAFSNNWLG